MTRKGPGSEVLAQCLVLHTRYRDIPWEEVAEEHRRSHVNTGDWESKVRGSAIAVITPPQELRERFKGCNGPFYEVVEGPKKSIGVFVCPHIAEIGD